MRAVRAARRRSLGGLALKIFFWTVCLGLIAGAFALLPPSGSAASRILLAGAAAAAAAAGAAMLLERRAGASVEARTLFTRMRSVQIGEFLSYVLYQLREYLITVTSIVEALALTPAKDQPGVGEKLERLRRVVGELNVKTARLLGDQTQVTTARQTKTSTFQIAESVETCAQAARELYGPSVQAVVIREGQVPPLRGDRRGFEASMLAVLQNSFEACLRKGGGRVSATIRVEGNKAQIEVSDDGGGIEGGLDALFEPLHAARRGTDGLGFGLSIGRRLMERAGGTLRVKTKPPYTAVLLELPLAQDLPFVRNEESTWAGRRDKI